MLRSRTLLPAIPNRPAHPFAAPHFLGFSLESKEWSQSKTVTCFTLFLIYFASYLLNLIPQFHGYCGFLLKGINRSGIWGCHRNCFSATASLPASSSPGVPEVVRALASTAEIFPVPPSTAPVKAALRDSRPMVLGCPAGPPGVFGEEVGSRALPGRAHAAALPCGQGEVNQDPRGCGPGLQAQERWRCLEDAACLSGFSGV